MSARFPRIPLNFLFDFLFRKLFVKIIHGIISWCMNSCQQLCVYNRILFSLIIESIFNIYCVIVLGDCQILGLIDLVLTCEVLFLLGVFDIDRLVLRVCFINFFLFDTFSRFYLFELLLFRSKRRFFIRIAKDVYFVAYIFIKRRYRCTRVNLPPLVLKFILLYVLTICLLQLLTEALKQLCKLPGVLNHNCSNIV